MQTVGLNRNTIDKYYTKPEVVKQCIAAFTSHLHINNNDYVIEPSAGNGSFIPEIKSITNNYLFYDLEPEHPEIIKQDFLEFNPPTGFGKTGGVFDKIHVIGNPPFGRQSSLAIKFIKKACSFCDSLSFVLPKSFKKDSMKSKFPLHFHLVYEADLPDNSFLVDGIEHDVPCVFQIWIKKETVRQVANKLEPHGFVFVDKLSNPDISFRRVGVNAGAIDTVIDNKSEQSHYFIKFNNKKSLKQNLEALATIEFEFNNTVGPKSISKQELIVKFNELL